MENKAGIWAAVIAAILVIGGMGAFVALRLSSEVAIDDAGLATPTAVPTPTPKPSPGAHASDGAAIEPLPPLIEPVDVRTEKLIEQYANNLEHEEYAAPYREKLLAFDCRALPVLDRMIERARYDVHAERIREVRAILADTPVRVGPQSYWPGVLVDESARTIVLEAVTLKPAKNIEFLFCTERGKGHESLFSMAGRAAHLVRALDAIAISPTTADQQPQFLGDWLLYDGGTVKIEVEFMRDGKLVRQPIEDFVRVNDARMKPTGWVYLGAKQTRGGALAAEELGTVAALYTAPTAILTNPWPASHNDGAHTAADLPPAKTPVHLILTPEADGSRRFRLQNDLVPEWNVFRHQRDKLIQELQQQQPPDPSMGGNPNAGTNGQNAGDPQTAPDATPNAAALPEKSPFPSVVPDLTAEEVAYFKRLVEGLSDSETRDASATALAKLDARFEILLDQTWRELRGDRVRAEPLATALASVPANPYVHDGIVYFRGLAVDPKRQLIIADAEVANYENMPLEFLICGPRGKGHESVISLYPLAKSLQWGLERIGIERSKKFPAFQGDWQLYDGGTVTIEVAFAKAGAEFGESGHLDVLGLADIDAYRADDRFTVLRAEQMVWDTATGAPMAETGFVFTGSESTPDDTLFADELGSIVGAYSGDQCVLENPWPGAGDAHAYRINAHVVPMRGTPMRLFIRPEPAEARAARMQQLQPHWDERRPLRPRMEFAAPEGWSPIGRRTDFVFLNADQASLAVNYFAVSTRETSITEGYKQFVRERTETDPEFNGYVHEKDLTHDGHPAWYFVWKDQDNAPVLRLVVMTKRFYYHVFFFYPARIADDLPALEKLFFEELLPRLKVGHPENRLATENNGNGNDGENENENGNGGENGNREENGSENGGE